MIGGPLDRMDPGAVSTEEAVCVATLLYRIDHGVVSAEEDRVITLDTPHTFSYPPLVKTKRGNGSIAW